MTLIDHISVLLGTLKKEDIEALTPVERERFRQRLEHWAKVAEKADQKPKGAIEPKDRPK